MLVTLVCTYKQEQAKTIDKLLKADRLPPQPPIKPTLFAKIGYEDRLKTVYEEVVNPEDPDRVGDPGRMGCDTTLAPAGHTVTGVHRGTCSPTTAPRASGALQLA